GRGEVAGDRADGVRLADGVVVGVERGGVGDDDVARAGDLDPAAVLHQRVPLDAVELAGDVDPGAAAGVAVEDAVVAPDQPAGADEDAVQRVVLQQAVGHLPGG